METFRRAYREDSIYFGLHPLISGDGPKDPWVEDAPVWRSERQTERLAFVRADARAGGEGVGVQFEGWGDAWTSQRSAPTR
jgi:hypothetical protein